MIEPYYSEDGITIYHGDCREILPQLGEKVDLVLTDPPYGMKLDASYRNSTPNLRKGIRASRGYDDIIGDGEDFDFAGYFSLVRSVKEQLWFGADYYCQMLPAAGSWLMWDKREGIEDVKYSSSEFELIWSRQKRKRKIYRVRWFGLCGTEMQDVRMRVHPAQKPLELIEEMVTDTRDAQTILDPFLGSGTTAVAAKRLGRKCIGIEISEAYCKIAVNRLKQMELFQCPQR